MKNSKPTRRTIRKKQPFAFTRKHYRMLDANHAAYVSNPWADLIPVVHMFQEVLKMNFLIICLDLYDRGFAFGIVDWGKGIVEKGWFDLREFAKMEESGYRIPMIDDYWSPNARVSDYMRSGEKTGVLNHRISVPEVTDLRKKTTPKRKNSFTMTQNGRAAFVELLSIGVPVYDHSGVYGSEFTLIGEPIGDGSPLYADYYGHEIDTDDGIHADVEAVLQRHGLRTEWFNNGQCGIFDDTRPDQ